MDDHHKFATQSERYTSEDILLANQLFYRTRAHDYEKGKFFHHSKAVRNYYRRILSQHVFSDVTASQLRTWNVLDVGCGTGFLEQIFAPEFGCVFGVDATFEMLKLAKYKTGNKRMIWIQADAIRLPFRAGSFDMVCSNALLHHVYDVEAVLAAMVHLLKPGGRVFLGYEPNAVPYKWLKPLILLAARVVPEHRQRERTHAASGQDAHPRLRGEDIHELAEFHIFHGRGFDPHRLRLFLEKMGVTSIRAHFTSAYQATVLRDSGIPFPVDLLPEWVYRLSGKMSLSFSVTGTKSG